MKTINVACIVLPNGQTILHKQATADNIRQYNKAWWNSLSSEAQEQHRTAGTMGGCVLVRMLESDYEAMPTNNEIAWPPKGGSD